VPLYHQRDGGSDDVESIVRNIGVTFNLSKKAKVALREVVGRHLLETPCQHEERAD
jgi:histone H3/H4